jgi:DNA-binding NarL/FixJ family response regulator
MCHADTGAGGIMILLATASHDLLASVGHLRYRYGNWLTVSAYDSMLEVLGCLQPKLVLLDMELPGLHRGRRLKDLAGPCSNSKLIALCHTPSDDLELDCIKYAGARGCCSIKYSADQLEHVIAAVERGELWIRRSLMTRLAQELTDALRGQAVKLEPRGPVALTQREREIALLVCAGNSNKQIARLLDITERTVKAHLSEIFRKMGIGDRLMLALRFAGPLEQARTAVA